MPSQARSFEERFDDISFSMCKCVSCFCCEAGFTSPLDPCCLSSEKILCCRGAAESNAEICEARRGLVSTIDKCLCFVESSTCTKWACGCCGMFCFGKPLQGGHTSSEDAWMTGIFWLYYAFCCGCGVASLHPLVHQDGKCCCLSSNSGTTGFCEGGCFHVRGKTCCCVNAVECPPTSDIGMAFCGKKCVGGTRAAARNPALRAPGHQEMQSI